MYDAIDFLARSAKCTTNVGGNFRIPAVPKVPIKEHAHSVIHTPLHTYYDVKVDSNPHTMIPKSLHDNATTHLHNTAKRR